MGDGSEGIWNQAQAHFPEATQIVDVYRARQHLWELARKLHPNEEANQNRWILVHQDLLEEGKIEDLLSALRSIATSNGERMEKIAPKRNTLNATRSACSTLSCAVSTCLSVQASSRLGAGP